jgi:hypothetical protein
LACVRWALSLWEMSLGPPSTPSPSSAGWLDQSWWPDGEYTAPTTDALVSDVQAVLDFGLNSIRLHQKVNPELWYAAADKLGVYILQDMVQKYGGASADTCNPFMQDLKAMMDGRYNHPSIIQIELFNEDDCWKEFDVPSVYAWAQGYDGSRLIDSNSGPDGRDPMSNRLGNVSDGHSYPWPRAPTYIAGQTQMIGEFGGIGAFVVGHEWTPGKCGTYLPASDPPTEAGIYVNMTKQLITLKQQGVSCCIYTQITDVERECDVSSSISIVWRTLPSTPLPPTTFSVAIRPCAHFTSDPFLFTPLPPFSGFLKYGPHK